jgi:hypothetical protein
MAGWQFFNEDSKDGDRAWDAEAPGEWPDRNMESKKALLQRELGSAFSAEGALPRHFAQSIFGTEPLDRPRR